MIAYGFLVAFLGLMACLYEMYIIGIIGIIGGILVVLFRGLVENSKREEGRIE